MELTELDRYWMSPLSCKNVQTINQNLSPELVPIVHQTSTVPVTYNVLDVNSGSYRS